MEGKNHIAHKVTEIIEEDDVIFLDISSTALSIAGILKNTNKKEGSVTADKTGTVTLKCKYKNYLFQWKTEKYSYNGV